MKFSESEGNVAKTPEFYVCSVIWSLMMFALPTLKPITVSTFWKSELKPNYSQLKGQKKEIHKVK